MRDIEFQGAKLSRLEIVEEIRHQLVRSGNADQGVIVNVEPFALAGELFQVRCLKLVVSALFIQLELQFGEFFLFGVAYDLSLVVCEINVFEGIVFVMQFSVEQSFC